METETTLTVAALEGEMYYLELEDGTRKAVFATDLGHEFSADEILHARVCRPCIAVTIDGELVLRFTDAEGGLAS